MYTNKILIDIREDLGKFDNDFVKTQCNLFLHKLSFKSCLDKLVRKNI